MSQCSLASINEVSINFLCDGIIIFLSCRRGIIDRSPIIRLRGLPVYSLNSTREVTITTHNWQGVDLHWHAAWAVCKSKVLLHMQRIAIMFCLKLVCRLVAQPTLKGAKLSYPLTRVCGLESFLERITEQNESSFIKYCRISVSCHQAQQSTEILRGAVVYAQLRSTSINASRSFYSKPCVQYHSECTVPVKRNLWGSAVYSLPVLERR